MINLNHEPKVSICIPTYNGAKYIRETLDCAISQTYTNIEIVICDDGSTDNTVSICEEYKNLDSRIRLYENEENLGLVENWINVIEKSTSKWIKFLFQDDLIEKDCVEKMINAATSYNVDFVICNREYFFSKKTPQKIQNFYTNIVKTEDVFPSNEVITPAETANCVAPYYFNNCIGEPPALLFNKKGITSKDFPTDYKQIIDYVFVLNQIMTKNFVFLNEKLLKFRVHGESQSMKNNDNSNLSGLKLNNYIHITYYERLLLCSELEKNPNFSEIAKIIPPKVLKHVKYWTIFKSYRKLGFRDVKAFYENSKLSSNIMNLKTRNQYWYISYKFYKIFGKPIRKKHNF